MKKLLLLTVLSGLLLGCTQEEDPTVVPPTREADVGMTPAEAEGYEERREEAIGSSSQRAPEAATTDERVE